MPSLRSLSRLTRRLLAAAGLSLALPAFAGPELWIGDAAGKLARVDVASGAVVIVGNMGLPMADIAFDPLGHLFGVSYDSTLFSINPQTGAASVIGGLGTNAVNSLVFDNQGHLYGASNQLYRIDTRTGTASAVGAGGIAFQSSGDLAFVGGNLYLTSTRPAADSLLRLDPATGAARLVGSTGLEAVYGLASDNGNTLYAVAGTRIYTLDTGSGRSTLLASYAGQGLGNAYGTAFIGEALALAPVSEPGSFALLLSGLAGISLLAWRRRAG